MMGVIIFGAALRHTRNVMHFMINDKSQNNISDLFGESKGWNHCGVSLRYC